MTDYDFILERLDQIYLIIKDIDQKLSIKSSGLSNDNDNDLIERFYQELERYQIDYKLDTGTYLTNDIMNKASYYFDNVHKITNKRSYLSKILSQVRVLDNTITEKTVEVDYRSIVKDYDNDKIDSIIDQLDTDRLDRISHTGTLVNMIIKGKDQSTWTDNDKREIIYRLIKHQSDGMSLIGKIS